MLLNSRPIAAGLSTPIAVALGVPPWPGPWQPGGGYDRNVVELASLQQMIEYIHLNPVRRGLVARPEDWPWSSARWYEGIRPVPIEMDANIPIIYDVGRKHR